MKAPRASCEGYLTLRTSPSSPPPMLRRYCFLVGTCFYYYSTQEDAYHMLRLKGEVDVLGVQEWDGKGNMHIYQYGFLFATAQNKVFYAYADTAMDKEKWMRAIQMTVETNMPRLPAIFTSHALTTLDSLSPSGVSVPVTDAETKCKCPHCKALEAASQTPATTMLYKCHSCDTLFCEKFTTHKIPLPHRSFYYSKRVCDDCYEAQMFLNYLKAIVERLKAGICLYPKPLNPDTPIELIMPQRPSHTEAANIAINMLKVGLITAEECEEILLADRRYLDHTLDQPEIPLDLKILALHREFRSRTFSVYRAVILLHRHLDSDPLLFKPIVEKLLHFSYTRINQVEFYWPQIVHAYLTVPMFDFEKIFWLDELIFSICSRSIHLALLLRWQLQGALEDAFDPNAPKDMQDKYARVVRLMVEVEQEVVGTDRATLLSRSPSERSRRSRLPMPTEEQLHLIEQTTAEIHLLTPKHPGLLTGAENSDDNETPMSIIEEDMVDNQPTSLFNGITRRMSQAEKSVLSQYFADECDFVQQITDIAEVLRFVPSIQERKKRLPGYLEKLRLPPMAYVPLVKATDPFERIVRIPTKEGTAFSTKARVPILLIFEVIRGNFFPPEQPALSPNSPHRKSYLGSEAISSSGVEYIEDDEVGRLIHHQAPEGFVDADESKQDEELRNQPNASAPRINPQVPETPIDVASNLATPATAQSRLNPLDEESDVSPNDDRAVSELDMDMSSVNLSEEVIERENDRRKDLEAAFGESWSSKRKRLLEASPYGHLPGWDIVSMIGKSNDDLRQEVFTLQLIQKFIEIFKAAKLPIWLRSYRIIATSSSTGLIETLANAISLDGLKKREGYVSLLHHFEKSYGPVNSPRFVEARRKYIQSMAGYSIVSYFLQIKDRHNGNIMLDNEGHIIHIDYGFLLGIAPGGSFSIETAPFKLTYEMVETMGGTDSEGFKEYVKLITMGFLACQQHCDEICDLVDIMSRQSPYPCFAGKDVSYILLRLRSRFKLTLSKQETVAHVLYLVRKSNSNYSTRQYDNFQRMTNGILP
uniref:1-phosphatidylinositol 4-kinase n=1 Tax=Globisporangium ultimum (strain ATCC 200006 / CBS 805.95 / DAOM BR144) TaxID=431595 RepID=K3WBP3_GLOUD